MNRHEWLKKIRESNTFGRGTCTTVDEAMEDHELMEFLVDFETYEEAWDMLVAVEEIHWERCGIFDWAPKEE
jgi:hypothetical protein